MCLHMYNINVFNTVTLFDTTKRVAYFMLHQLIHTCRFVYRRLVRPVVTNW